MLWNLQEVHYKFTESVHFAVNQWRRKDWFRKDTILVGKQTRFKINIKQGTWGSAAPDLYQVRACKYGKNYHVSVDNARLYR